MMLPHATAGLSDHALCSFRCETAGREHGKYNLICELSQLLMFTFGALRFVRRTQHPLYACVFQSSSTTQFIWIQFATLLRDS